MPEKRAEAELRLSHDKTQILWDEVLKEPDPVQALRLAVTVGQRVAEESYTERALLREELITFRKMILGNGDPKNSLVSRLDSIERLGAENNQEIKKIKILLVGDIGEINTDCLCERIKSSERAIANMTRLGWIILGAVGAQFALKLLGLF